MNDSKIVIIQGGRHSSYTSSDSPSRNHNMQHILTDDTTTGNRTSAPILVKSVTQPNMGCLIKMSSTDLN
jgi:hypothetical protein